MISGALLVGGESRRFGRDKTLWRLGGETLVERLARRLACGDSAVTDDLLIVGNRLERFTELAGLLSPDCEGPAGDAARLVPDAARLVPDAVSGLGVVGGLYTALLEARHAYVFVAACDLPFLNVDLVRFLAGLADGADDVIMPYVHGFVEPLHAVYGKSTLPAVRRLIETGERQVRSFFPYVRVRLVSEDEMRPFDPELRSFFNLNRPEDVASLDESSP